MSKDDALKLALEALTHGGCPPDCKDGMTDSGGAHPWGEAVLIPCPNCRTIDFIREALVDSALDRMAENARELGLDYEPPCKTGSQCTNKCQQCEQPAQEPVAWPCVIAEADFEKDTITLEMQCSDYMVRAGQHWLSTSPQPSKPWVGLTDEEIDELDRKNYGFPQPVAWRGPFARAVEAKLKERNA